MTQGGDGEGERSRRTKVLSCLSEKRAFPRRGLMVCFALCLAGPVGVRAELEMLMGCRACPRGVRG